jgi:hypothetical protein
MREICKSGSMSGDGKRSQGRGLDLAGTYLRERPRGSLSSRQLSSRLTVRPSRLERLSSPITSELYEVSTGRLAPAGGKMHLSSHVWAAKPDPVERKAVPSDFATISFPCPYPLDESIGGVGLDLAGTYLGR